MTQLNPLSQWGSTKIVYQRKGLNIFFYYFLDIMQKTWYNGISAFFYSTNLIVKRFSFSCLMWVNEFRLVKATPRIVKNYCLLFSCNKSRPMVSWNLTLFSLNQFRLIPLKIIIWQYRQNMVFWKVILFSLNEFRCIQWFSLTL